VKGSAAARFAAWQKVVRQVPAHFEHSRFVEFAALELLAALLWKLLARMLAVVLARLFAAPLALVFLRMGSGRKARSRGFSFALVGTMFLCQEMRKFELERAVAPLVLALVFVFRRFARFGGLVVAARRVELTLTRFFPQTSSIRKMLRL